MTSLDRAQAAFDRLEPEWADEEETMSAEPSSTESRPIVVYKDGDVEHYQGHDYLIRIDQIESDERWGPQVRITVEAVKDEAPRPSVPATTDDTEVAIFDQVQDLLFELASWAWSKK